LHRNSAELAEQGLLPEPVREFVANDRGRRELDRFLAASKGACIANSWNTAIAPGDQFRIVAMYFGWTVTAFPEGV
jgi:hypothetical protein